MISLTRPAYPFLLTPKFISTKNENLVNQKRILKFRHSFELHILLTSPSHQKIINKRLFSTSPTESFYEVTALKPSAELTIK